MDKPDNFINSFIKGANKGWDMVTKVIFPNVIFAFVITFILQRTGITNLLGKVLSPIMGLLGLPGEASIPLVISYFALADGVASAVSLFSAGTLTSIHLSIMLPFMFLIGATIQYLGRILAPSGIAKKHYIVCIIIATLNAMLSLWLMDILIKLI